MIIFFRFHRLHHLVHNIDIPDATETQNAEENLTNGISKFIEDRSSNIANMGPSTSSANTIIISTNTSGSAIYSENGENSGNNDNFEARNSVTPDNNEYDADDDVIFLIDVSIIYLMIILSLFTDNFYIMTL